MVQGRVEECLQLSLDNLPGSWEMKWRTSCKVAVPWEDGWRADGERSHVLMVVIRRYNELFVSVEDDRSSYPLACHDVAIDPRRRGGYIEFLICPGCDRRARTLFLPRGAEEFRCRGCYRLAYTSQFRHRNPFEKMISIGASSGRRRARPGMAGLAALRVATQSPDPLAVEVFVRGPGRPRKNLAPPRKKPGRPKSKRSYKRQPYDKKIGGMGDAYCVKCKEFRPIAQPVLTAFKNGRPAIAGACPVCGTRLWRATARANSSVKLPCKSDESVSGGPGGIRTHDSRIKSPELYR